jgi:CRISPR-associated protein Cas2
VIVLILERTPPTLRGELSRWLIEPKAGVFVGKLSAMVREKLWQLVVDRKGVGAAMLLQSAETEQGFRIRTHGDTSRTVLDFEGLQLVRFPREEKPPPAQRPPRAG